MLQLFYSLVGTPVEYRPPLRWEHLNPAFRQRLLDVRFKENAKWPLVNLPSTLAVAIELLRYMIEHNCEIDFFESFLLTKAELDREWMKTILLYQRLGREISFKERRLQDLIEAQVNIASSFLERSLDKNDRIFSDKAYLLRILLWLQEEIGNFETPRTKHHSKLHKSPKWILKLILDRMKHSITNKFRGLIRNNSELTRAQSFALELLI